MSRISRPELSAEELRHLLHYDPQTGVFTRKVTTAGYNGRAGQVAGGLDDNGYCRISVKSYQFKANQLAWLWMTGEWPKIDAAHQNGDRADNRWENLRDEKPMQRRRRRSPEREALLKTPRPGAKGRREDGVYVHHNNEHMVPIDLLRRRVDYDPYTGELRWKKEVPVSDFIDERGCRIWHGKFAGKPILKRNRGYVIVSISVNLKTIYCQGHRVAWALMTGAWPDNQIDHRNGDRTDNAWANLREATHHANQWNKGLSVRNRSGFKGVHRDSQGKWVAQIRVDGRTRTLGRWDVPEPAAEAYRLADQQAHGEFAANI